MAVDEVLAGREAVHVAKNRFAGQEPLERVAQPAGEARRILAPIADERAAVHGVPTL